MTLRQPADGHGGNAGIDEEASMSHESLSERVALIQSTRSWSSLQDVALAVSVASESGHRIYVERRSDLYRWSLAHSGGGYPLLRITARFLHVDHGRIFVGFRTLPNGMAIMCDDPNVVEEPDTWAILEPTKPVSASDAVELITNSLGNDALPT
jgi:hypothetical protein